jgi:hypothetical protein
MSARARVLRSRAESHAQRQTSYRVRAGEWYRANDRERHRVERVKHKAAAEELATIKARNKELQDDVKRLKRRIAELEDDEEDAPLPTTIAQQLFDVCASERVFAASRHAFCLTYESRICFI